jgi:hypothetical protein
MEPALSGLVQHESTATLLPWQGTFAWSASPAGRLLFWALIAGTGPVSEGLRV